MSSTISNGKDGGGHRFLELDGLRGIAAAVVVLGHAASLAPAYREGSNDSWWVRLLQDTPLNVSVAAGGAVTVFFVLSGFVLMLPFLRASKPSILGFEIRRVTRLFPAYLFALALGAVVLAMTGKPSPEGMSGFMDIMWLPDFEWGSFLHQLLPWTVARQSEFDPPVWSLFVEFRASLVFPLIAFAVIWGRTAGSLVLAAGFFGVGLAGTRVGLWSFEFAGVGHSIVCIACFVAGAWLAANFDAVARAHRATAGRLPWLLPLLALGLIFVPEYALQNGNELLSTNHPLGMICVSVASLILILLAQTSLSARKILMLGPVQYLGRISYSLYLIHLVVFSVALQLLWDSTSPVVAIVVAIIGSVLLAELMRRTLEVPGIELGRRLSAKLAKPTRSQAPNS